MSTFECPVVKIESLVKHPNADSLSITKVFGYPMIVRTEDWVGRDLAVYIPVDAFVPVSRPEFAFLGEHPHIKAKKLRGIFSQGLLIPAPEGAQLGENLAEFYGITKYEKPIHLGAGAVAPPPGPTSEYTEIEHVRRYHLLFEPGEEVVITEKVDGGNVRYAYRDGQVHAGTHHQWVDRGGLPWRVVTPQFEEFLKTLPDNYVLFGEIYGWVQDLHYGHTSGQVSFLAFDIQDAATGQYLSTDEFDAYMATAAVYGIKPVPVLYRGPWDFALAEELADKDSTVCPGQIQEGVVVRSAVEKWTEEIGRKTLKLHSKRYLTSKFA